MTPREQIQKRIDEMRAARERYDSVFDTSFLPTVHAELPGILDALETLSALANSLSATDISENPPDFLWLQSWRHDAKNMSSNALAQAAKDLGEG